MQLFHIRLNIIYVLVFIFSFISGTRTHTCTYAQTQSNISIIRKSDERTFSLPLLESDVKLRTYFLISMKYLRLCLADYTYTGLHISKSLNWWYFLCCVLNLSTLPTRETTQWTPPIASLVGSCGTYLRMVDTSIEEGSLPTRHLWQ